MELDIGIYWVDVCNGSNKPISRHYIQILFLLLCTWFSMWCSTYHPVYYIIIFTHVYLVPPVSLNTLLFIKPHGTKVEYVSFVWIFMRHNLNVCLYALVIFSKTSVALRKHKKCVKSRMEFSYCIFHWQDFMYYLSKKNIVQKSYLVWMLMNSACHQMKKVLQLFQVVIQWTHDLVIWWGWGFHKIQSAAWCAILRIFFHWSWQSPQFIK